MKMIPSRASIYPINNSEKLFLACIQETSKTCANDLYFRKTTNWCNECHLDFDLSNDYMSHIRFRHCSEVQRCNLCNDKIVLFDDQQALNEHFKEVHGFCQRDILICKICNKCCENLNDFRLHIETLHTKFQNLRSNKLNDCSIGLSNTFKYSQKPHIDDSYRFNLNFLISVNDYFYYSVNKRELRIEKSDFLNCDCCNFNFENWYDFVKHLEETLHKSYLITYFCVKCHLSFKKEEDIREHVRLHLIKNAKETCNICKSIFNTPLQLEYHSISEHEVLSDTLKCFHCNETFDESEEFYFHLLEHRLNGNLIKCHLCNTAFFLKNQLLSHIISHQESLEKLKQLSNSKYISPSVQLTNRSSNTAINQIKKKQNANANKLFECNLCTRSFTCKFLFKTF